MFTPSCRADLLDPGSDQLVENDRQKIAYTAATGVTDNETSNDKKPKQMWTHLCSVITGNTQQNISSKFTFR